LRILVTGGSRGIGKDICDKFIKEGHEVISPTREELDLSTSFSYIPEQIDVLVNNAGINIINSIFEGDNEREIMQVNYFSPLKLFKLCLPHMKKQNYGRVVNIGSVWVDYAKPGRSSYSASKNALHSLTKAITSEYGTYNILANTVSPGFFMTDMTFQNNTDEAIKDLRSKIPVGRLGYTSEVADLVYFLSVRNSYISGQNIVIDGGYSCTAK
jgi:3-oxoacyl-[acyl-carrier protein] reductase